MNTDKNSAKLSIALTLGTNGIVLAGGLTLAATAAGPVGLALGLGVAAFSGYRGALSFIVLKDVEKNLESVKGKSIKEAQDAMAAKYKMPKLFLNPVFMAAISLMTLAAGVALFGTVGPLASVLGVAMAGLGGLGFLGAGMTYLVRGPLSGTIDKIMKEAGVEGEQAKKVPANDLSPAAKLDSKQAVADFSAAANENKSEPTPTKPEALPKPPQFG